jgi:hypothetical protein
MLKFKFIRRKVVSAKNPSERDTTYNMPLLVRLRVARFFLVHDTKTGKNVPNENKIYHRVIKYPKAP